MAKNEDTSVRIGERIRDAREARGWTQYQLGVAVGRRDGDISRYENGKVDPKVIFVRDCAVALGVAWEYLTGLTDDLQGSLDPKWSDPGAIAESAPTPAAPKGQGAARRTRPKP